MEAASASKQCNYISVDNRCGVASILILACLYKDRMSSVLIFCVTDKSAFFIYDH